MAIPVTNIPVLTGEVAERFIEQCEYNAQHLRGSEYRGEFIYRKRLRGLFATLLIQQCKKVLNFAA